MIFFEYIVYKIKLFMLFKFILTSMLTSFSMMVQGQFLIRNVQLFDGHEVHSSVSVKIESGIITAIGDMKDMDGLELIDGTGKTIIPGLINSHVHAWIPFHLKNAMEAGVFAVLDMNSQAEQTMSLRDFSLEDGYAKFYSSGYAATVEGGHGTQYGYEVPTIGKHIGAKEFVSQAIGNEVDYIKIIYEPSKNTLSLDQVAELVQESHNSEFLAVAHISDYEAAKVVVETSIDGLVHLWRDEMATERFLQKLVDAKTFIIPTLSVLEGVINYYQENGIVKEMLSMDNLLNQIRELHAHDIKLLAGTDPPNVGLDYGWSLHNELELFVKAGLSPLEALKTATSNPSETFSIEHLGTVKEGRLANFNLIDGDPLKEISDSRKIVAQWANGIKIK